MDISILTKRFFQILYAPFNYPEMFWISLPLIITLILVELYLGRYKDEELNWSSLLTNSLVFVFVGLDLLRKLTTEDVIRYNYNIKLLLAVIILVVGVLLVFTNYFHSISPVVSKIFSSFLFVNAGAYLVIIAVYGNYSLDIYYFLSSVIFIVGLWLLFRIIHIFQPKKV
jgi:hypothetical protein